MTFYLSKLRLNPNSRQTQNDLRNPYDLHRTLTFAVAGEDEALPEGERLLWRLDGEHSPTLIVQSCHAPDWSRLLTRHLGYLDTFQTTLVDDTRLRALSRPEALYRFRLRANPSLKKAGKRYGLYSAPAQTEWLEQQALKAGFVPVGFDIVHSERFRARKGGTPMTLCAATFEGLLRVTDPALLQAALCNGLGHGKALGLGLLSLAPTG